MRILPVTICFLCLTAAVADHAPNPAAAGEKPVEVLEEFEVVTPEDEAEPGIAWGAIRHAGLKFSGPAIWLAMALAIATRHIRVKGRARRLSAIHKGCGYTAFGLGTLHGILGLFL